jgi:hypothetical protein
VSWAGGTKIKTPAGLAGSRFGKAWSRSPFGPATVLRYFPSIRIKRLPDHFVVPVQRSVPPLCATATFTCTRLSCFPASE